VPFRICKIIEIENGHMLSKHPDKCRFPHGHSRKIEFVLEATELDQRDMVCDFKVLRTTMDSFLEQYDHAMCVNTEDPQYEALRNAYGERVIGFPNTDPTTEMIAKRFFEACQERLLDYAKRADARYPLQANVRLVKVRVWETSSSWAEYQD
jgi:6-pyruvoyltetrahydropterin/6-carboxytetrahydropterin synthase